MGTSAERMIFLNNLRESVGEPYIWGQYYRDIIKVRARDILYIENTKHGSVVYAQKKCMTPPFENGIISKEKLSHLYRRLSGYGFAYSHNSYLVNLQYVERVKKGKELLLTDGTRLSISRSRAKSFLQRLTSFL